MRVLFDVTSLVHKCNAECLMLSRDISHHLFKHILNDFQSKETEYETSGVKYNKMRKQSSRGVL